MNEKGLKNENVEYQGTANFFQINSTAACGKQWVHF
jgi:hypothetical protein